MTDNKLQQKLITEKGPGYVSLHGELYTWIDGWLRYVKDGDKNIKIPNYGQGWYHMADILPQLKPWGSFL